jgi:hypothetical protein
MVEGLMHICQGWGDSYCHPDVSEPKLPRETGPGEPARLWPCGEEQRRLDEICRFCKHRIFTIEKPECPICEKESIEPGTYIRSFSSGPVKPSFEEFIYKCRICGTDLISHLKFFGS